MPHEHQLPIEQYALIGNTHTAALVGSNGSIDWLCLPQFDSPACFAALVGDIDNGRWRIAPEPETRAVRRRYRDNTLTLETELATADGTILLVDFMPCPADEDRMDLVRIVRGCSGRVAMRSDAVFRFDYGQLRPWVRRIDGGIEAVAGPDALQLLAPVQMRGEAFHTVASFEVGAGEEVPFVLTWRRSHLPPPSRLDPGRALAADEEMFRRWAAKSTFRGRWRPAVDRSLLTLKALTFAPTGGLVAAPTTSLPEKPGGIRNWDYRYCWLRDATFTLYSLMISGHMAEAHAWRDWLLRAIAGDPSQLHILYGINGERSQPERELTWLAGYADSRPVRIGNAAHAQLQIDVFGEIMDMFHAGRRFGIEPHDYAWHVQKALLQFLEHHWDDPDEGIWEVRGPRRHFTHSKVMAWVAFDRAVKAVERHGLDGPVDRWRMLRGRIHAEVCARGFDEERGHFVQYYGGRQLDAALLMIPLVGFLSCEDPRVRGTVEAIGSGLMVDGLVRRYQTREDVDGLPAGEGAFLACSFWYADVLNMLGQRGQAEELFEHLLGLRNDVGLLAEEYDPRTRRQLGNFPQAFSHIALVNTAHNLSPEAQAGPAERHASGEPDRSADRHEDRSD